MALAASSVDMNAFLSLVTLITLKYNGNKIEKPLAFASKWLAQAKPLLDACPDVSKELSICLNITTLKKTVKAAQIEALATAMKDKTFQKFLDASIQITPRQIKFAKLLTSHILANTDEKVASTWEKIESHVPDLHHPSLNALVVDYVSEKANLKLPPVTSSVKEAAAQAATIVKSVSGRSNCFLNIREVQALMKSNPKVAKSYGAASKIVGDFANDAIKKLILASGNTSAPVANLVQKMQSAGIQHKLPVNFTGNVGVLNDKLVYFTKEGLQLDRIPSFDVVMNPKFDPAAEKLAYVCFVPGIKGNLTHCRTIAGTAKNKSSGFSSVALYAKDEETHREKWLKDLMTFDPKRNHGRPDKKIVLAALVEILYQTRHRIGGEKNKTGDTDTFGISTLKLEHVTFHKTYMTYNYTGKKLAQQSSKLSLINSPAALKLGQVLHALVDARKDSKNKVIPAKGPKDRLFTWRTAAHDKPIPAAAVTKYLKEDLGVEISAHKLRHAVATNMAMQILAKSKFKPGKATQKEVDTWVKEQFKTIGKVLHHKGSDGEVTGDTAIKSYVDPGIMHTFYEGLGLRTYKNVPAKH